VADLPGAVAVHTPCSFTLPPARRWDAGAAGHFAACERQQALVCPVAVIWEVSLLARASQINLRRPIRAFATISSAILPTTRST
jgi:hypothetical protein